MAGYSGGRKVIAPGRRAPDTITTFHAPRFMEHPQAANCVLDGNPLHEEQLEIVRMLGGALALNTVIDEERRLSFVNFGEIVASHRAAVELIRAYAEVPVAETFQHRRHQRGRLPARQDLLPDRQGHGRADRHPGAGRRPDHRLGLLRGHGLGRVPRRAEAPGRASGAERFLAEISAKRFADIDEWQTEMQLKPMRLGTIQLYSEGLPEADHGLTGVEMIRSIGAAVRRSVSRSGDRRVAVIPEGPYVVPVYRPAA